MHTRQNYYIQYYYSTLEVTLHPGNYMCAVWLHHRKKDGAAVDPEQLRNLVVIVHAAS